jgi:hypothetical protein
MSPETFLAHRRLAMVGVSRQDRDFSRGLFRASAATTWCR